MKNNSSGLKVQLWSWIFCIIGMLVSVIGGVIVAVESESFLAFLLVAGGGAFVCYIISLPMRAFGELVEDASMIADYVLELKKSDEKKVHNNEPITNNNRDFSAKKTHAAPPGTWTCPVCGRHNANYVGTCACGQTK